MKEKIAELLSESTYHIYNRANGSEKLFITEDNYRYFLEKYVKYINPIGESLCYCLMPNHFHFIIRIRDEIAIEKAIINKTPKALTGFQTLSGLNNVQKNRLMSDFISRQFSNLFNGYSKAFNKENNRKGGLFMRPFKRIQVTDEIYLRKLVRYIHFNPVEANLCNRPDEWRFSSYSSILSESATFFAKEKTINLFGDVVNFINIHKVSQFH